MNPLSTLMTTLLSNYIFKVNINLYYEPEFPFDVKFFEVV